MTRQSTTTILVTRHGLSEHNLRTDVYMGRSPAARLLPEGREQARNLAQRLSNGVQPQRIVCSSLPRTMETGEVIRAALGLGAIEAEDAFWELSKGAWEGVMPRVGLAPDLQAALDADPFGYRYPLGESYGDVVARVGPAFERWVAASAGQTVLFVLHGDVIRALLYHLLRFPREKIGDFVVDPCSLTEFHRSHGRYHLLRYNDASHLPAPVGLGEPETASAAD